MMDRNLKNEILTGRYIPRASQVVTDEEMRKDSEVMRILVKSNNKMICLYLGKDEDVFELAIKYGFDITEEFLNKYPNLCSSKSIMIQAINKYKNGNLIFSYTGSDEKVFETAISNGLEVTEELLRRYPDFCKSFSIMKEVIKKKPDLVKLYNNERAYGNHKFSLEEIDKLYTAYGGYYGNDGSYEQEKRNIDNYKILVKCRLYLLAIKCGYKYSLDEMQEFITRFTLLYYPNLISLYNGNDGKLIDFAIKHGYILKKQDIINKKSFRKSSIAIKKMIAIDCNNILYYEGNDDGIFKFALDRGFVPNENNLNEYMLNSYSIMLELIKSNPNMISKYTGNQNILELMSFAIKHGYIPIIEDFEKYKNDNDLIELMIPVSIRTYPNCIMYYRGNNEEIFEVAIKNGFKLTEQVFDEIIKNRGGYGNNNYKNFVHSKCIIKHLLEIDRELVYRGDFITYEYAGEFGFVPSKEDIVELYEGREDFDDETISLLFSSTSMYNAIKKDSSLIVYYLGRDENVFKMAINNGYVPNNSDLEKYKNLCNSSTIMEYIIDNIEPFKDNDKLKVIIHLEKLNIAMSYSTLKKIDNFLRKKSIYSVYNDYDILKICKYIIVLDNEDDEELSKDELSFQENFYKIIDNGHLDILDKFIKYMFDISSCNKEYIIFLIENVNSFYNNFELIEDVANDKELSSREKMMVLDIISSYNSKFKSLKEIREYNNSRFTDLDNEINNYSINELHNIVREFFGNYDVNTLGEFEVDEKYLTSIEELNKIRDNIVDENLKSELTTYLLYFEFLRKLQNINDLNSMRNIVKRIINYAKHNSSIDIFYEFMSKFNRRFKVFYAQEIKEKLFNFNSLSFTSQNDDYKVEKEKFLASDISLYGELIGGKKVDYIELDGIDYIALVHVLNAYGSGGMLCDFKYPRSIGKSYICLSAIANEKMATATLSDSEETKDEDKVTLLFNNIDVDQFVMESNNDLYSYGSIGSLSITSERSEHYLPINDLINNNSDNRHNELVFYREKDNGGYIYPTAILAFNNPPQQSEINAAAYLNIPIVYVNKEKYINGEKKKETSVENDKVEVIKQYKEMLTRLNELREEILKGKNRKA